MTTSTKAAVAESVTLREAVTEMRDCQGINDARLVEMTREGGQEAFAELVRRYENRLIRVISRFILDPVMVEDIAQEVFLRAYRRLELFDPSRRFGPWLFQIGVNMTLDHLRKTQRRIKWSLFSQNRNEEQRSIDPATADPRDALDLSQEVRLVLDQIPEKYRTVLVLRDLENFSTSEIAAITNRKEARAKFQKLWTARQQRDSIAGGAEVDYA